MWRPKWWKPWMSYKTPVTTEVETAQNFIEIKSAEYVKRWNESDILEQRASKLMLDFLQRYITDSEWALSRIEFITNKLKYYNDQMPLANRVRRELKEFVKHNQKDNK